MSVLRVLVVDDSAFARKVLREALNHPEIEVVATARDGLDALEKIATYQPDVITLDLVMPELDGLGVLAALTPEQRARVVIVSMAEGQSDIGVAALAAGVFDIVHKPTALAIERLQEIGKELVQKVLQAGRAAPLAARGITPDSDLRPSVARSSPSERVLVIGASTGGPQAISHLLRALPGDFPAPTAVVLHIPPGYTAPFAERLNRECELEVVEAARGTEGRPGRVIVARAGIHLKLFAPTHGIGFSTLLDLEPLASYHRPSVDALFESAAAAFGERVLGVVLTGMGDDGLAGARAVVAAGGQVLAEAEASCVVYGMPRAVSDAGLASACVTLSDMAAALLERL